MRSAHRIFKRRAIALRKKGKTYGEIKQIIGAPIPKSTLTNWFKGIVLSPSYRKRLSKAIIRNIRKAQIKALISNRKKREAHIESIKNRVRHFLIKIKNKDTAKIALAMLYLGEGAKWNSHAGLQLGSSDPDIIKIYIKLLQKCYGISMERLRARIMYRADQDIEALTNFWSSVTRIPKINFYKTKPDLRTIGKRTIKKNYRGVCAISCGGTEIQLELNMIAKMFLTV